MAIEIIYTCVYIQIKVLIFDMARCLIFLCVPELLMPLLITLHNEKFKIVIIITECSQIRAKNVACLAKFLIRIHSENV